MSTSKRAIKISHIWLLFFGSGLSLYGLIMIIVYYTTGVNLLFTVSLPIVGVILLLAGISNILTYRFNRQKVLSTLRSYERVSLSQLSSELNFREKKVKQLIVELRTEGKLKASFEPATGDVLVFEIKGDPVMAVVPVSSSGLPEHEEKYKDKQIPKEHHYCSHCGSIVRPCDQFCNTCGSYMS
ncbi:MAG: zinc ribbon domain-containing protein [Candidatus Heimdallarchaeota archaeon]|nr:zinc ribbon domain-containing protein [Candidatus Heimdallarchaeota archaeon]